MQPRPKRTGFGRAGRNVELVANHFPVVCQLKQVSMHFFLGRKTASASRHRTRVIELPFIISINGPVECPLHMQAFHYDVTITSVRRKRPEGEMDAGPDDDKKDAEPRAPAKPLTPELSRSL